MKNLVITFENRDDMIGVYIIASAVLYDVNGDEQKDYQEFVGRNFFCESELQAEEEARAFFSKKLNIPEVCIEFEQLYTENSWD